MAQTPGAVREPLLAYLDSNILVYRILQSSHAPGPGNRRRYGRSRQEAMRLFAVFARHTGPLDRITVVTCQWALTETHSVLYKDALWHQGPIPAQHRTNPRFDPRRMFPPDVPSLQRATSLLSTEMQSIRTVVALQIEEPGTELWATAQGVAEQCGIYAPDCLHLAAALHAGCELFVSQDIDFLNKIIHLQQGGIIAQISAGLFPPGMAPSFEACPLRASQRLLAPLPEARQRLASLGYT